MKRSILAVVLLLILAVPGFAQSPLLTPFAAEMRGVGPGGIPVAVPDGTRTYLGGAVTADHYTIDINQFSDTLHPELPPTTLWGYNPRNALGEKGTPLPRHLGGILVVHEYHPVQITFRNNLPTEHILPVDTTIMGAEPGTAKNRTSVHLHGGLVPWTSDGGPYAWWDPQGGKGPSFLNNQVLRPGQNVPANEAEYYYPNNQSARLAWYHDHALGITRLNAYAGVASAYVIRDSFEERILVGQLGLPGFVENGGREFPIVIQDKVFLNADDPTFPGSAKTKGSLWYPFVYDPNKWEIQGGTPPSISIIPEMFGDTMLVNGTVQPKATVAPRRYRLRILNACQARFLNLQLYEDRGDGQPNLRRPGPDFLVIGTEGGFLARPVRISSGVPLKILPPDPASPGDRMVDPVHPGGTLITAPAERWDLVVDFNGKGGKKYILCNDAPAPYPMGAGVNDYPDQNGIGDTQRLMRFEVKQDNPTIAADPPLLISPFVSLAGHPLSGIDKPLAGLVPQLPAAAHSWLFVSTLPLPVPTRPGINVRQLTLNESFDGFGRLIQMLGTNVPMTLGDFSRGYMDDPTETPKPSATEVWQIVNLTADTHPIHFHLANAQLLSRRPFDVNKYLLTPPGMRAQPVYTGPARGPDELELGWKETVKMHPGEVSTVIMKFDLPIVPFHVPFSPRPGINGYEYVWHCHILEHEEHDMMRPLVVRP
jgi:spore coat protein A, manganese oxidase